jgi:hypothetical protein
MAGALAACSTRRSRRTTQQPAAALKTRLQTQEPRVKLSPLAWNARCRPALPRRSVVLQSHIASGQAGNSCSRARSPCKSAAGAHNTCIVEFPRPAISTAAHCRRLRGALNKHRAAPSTPPARQPALRRCTADALAAYSTPRSHRRKGSQDLPIRTFASEFPPRGSICFRPHSIMQPDKFYPKVCQ